MLRYGREQNVIISSLLSEYSSLIAGFSTREAGDCRQIPLLRQHLQTNDIFPRKIVILEQIHSANIAKPDPEHLGDFEKMEESDGILSKEQGACLVVHTADCVPVLYFDPVSGIIGASHNGWMGTLKNLTGEMIHTMIQNGSKAENIRIAIGPAINSCCYDIDLDRYAQFMEKMERFNKIAFRPHGEKFHVNLSRLTYELAREGGIRETHIDHFPFCTFCDKERFFSYRRQFKTHPKEFGEMMAYIMLK